MLVHVRSIACAGGARTVVAIAIAAKSRTGMLLSSVELVGNEIGNVNELTLFAKKKCNFH